MLVVFNSYWYVGLVFLSLLLLVYIFIQIRSNQVLLLFMGAVGLGYMIESVIYDFLNSYQYYPELLPNNPYYDSNLGSFVSNAFSLPVTATFIAVFRKKWYWILLFTGIFAGIEYLFVYLHIYRHNWWRIGYTAISLPFYYAVINLFYKKLQQPLEGYWNYLLTFFIVISVSDTMHILPIMLFSNRYYQLGWYKNIYLDTNSFAAIYYLASSFLIIIVVKLRLIHKWIKLGLVASGTLLMDIFLSLTGILHSLVWWDPLYYLLLSIIIFLISDAVSKRLSLTFFQRKYSM